MASHGVHPSASPLRLFVPSCAPRGDGGWVASHGVHPSASPPSSLRAFVPSCAPAPAVDGRALVETTTPGGVSPLCLFVPSCLRVRPAPAVGGRLHTECTPAPPPLHLFVPSCLRVRPAATVGGRALVETTTPGGGLLPPASPALRGAVVRFDFAYPRRRRARPITPQRALATRAIEAGSGTAWTVRRAMSIPLGSRR